VADDTGVAIDATGGAWTQTKLGRLNAAAATWRDNTRFDIGRDTNSPHEFYVDASVPACGSSWDPSTLRTAGVGIETMCGGVSDLDDTWRMRFTDGRRHHLCQPGVPMSRMRALAFGLIPAILDEAGNEGIGNTK